jgi:hypothetical protein
MRQPTTSITTEVATESARMAGYWTGIAGQPPAAGRENDAAYITGWRTGRTDAGIDRISEAQMTALFEAQYQAQVP